MRLVHVCFQLASKGKLQELESILSGNKSKSAVVDKKGRGLLHHAAARNQLAVLDFLLAYGIGMYHFLRLIIRFCSQRVCIHHINK